MVFFGSIKDLKFSSPFIGILLEDNLCVSVATPVKYELLFDAAKLVIQNQQASVSLLQRRLKIGYSRAGRLIDELEALGVVSGYSGSKARDVLVDESYLDQIFN